MRKVLKWAALFALTLPIHLVVVLAITGFPKPPALTTESVRRVAWTPVLQDAKKLLSSTGSLGLVTWMPDGSSVLVQGRRMLLDNRLHTLATPGGDPVFLPQIPRNASVRSAPGRDYMVLAWDSNGNEQYRLYRWDLGDSEPVLLTSEEERAAFGAFDPNGDRIAYTSTRRNGTDVDIYLMDVLDPANDQRILEPGGTWAVAGWSPHADELLLIKAKSNVETEIHVLDIVSGSLTQITNDDDEVAYGVPQWSRDGTALYYTSDRGSEFKQLRRLDLLTKDEVTLSDEIPWDITSVQQTGDGEMLLIAVNVDGRTKHFTTDPMGEEFTHLDLFPSGEFSAGLHRTEPLVMVNHSDPAGDLRGYIYDLRTQELTLWTGSSTAESDVAEPRLIRYPTFDEVDGEPRQIPAFVYAGVGDGPRPVLINIHGGPEAQARYRTGQGATEKAGITLITPNVRGSTGYGRTYASLDDKYLREDAVRDIGSLLDWIEEQPDMDASRVAVTGGSYGGYMVLASLVHYSPRLRCGIDIVGVSNFVTFLENTADYRRDIRRAEYGDERIPEMRAFLEEIAPLNNAERITSQLMVVQGANDPRVPVTEARQIVERVRANDRTVPYIEAANEGHGFRDPWNSFYTSHVQRKLVNDCLLGG